MNVSLNPCSVGGYLKAEDECHLSTYSRKAGFCNLVDCSHTEFILLQRRSGVRDLKVCDTVCFHHKKVYLDKYELLQRKCCDPLGVHCKVIRKKLCVIDIEAADRFSLMLGKEIAPGRKLCCNCFGTLLKLDSDVSVCGDELVEDPDLSQTSSASVNASLISLGCSPVRFRKLNKQQRVAHGKRKLQQAQEAFQDKISLAIGEPSSKLCVGKGTEDCSKCSDYDALLSELKVKCAASTKLDKLQILTLAPKSWSIERVAEEFDVTEHLVRQARKLRESGGIMARAVPRTGKRVSDELKKDVIGFYEDDEASRLCPGKKDFISVKLDGHREQKQKRLLLCNLRELYVLFKERTKHKLGFSKFCELRPKWCISAGSSGTHCVCVCTTHQNVKLMLASLDAKLDYIGLLSKIVCSVENKDCMLYRCPSCPGKLATLEFLNRYVREDLDPEDDINFMQWVTTGRTTLVMLQLSVQELIVYVTEKLNELTAHHFIAKHQSAFLRKLKENLPINSCIIILDFAENYSFVVQDSVQSFYWDNTQATVHPVAVYYRCNGQMQCISICFISDCLTHDTMTVYAFQHQLLKHVREVIPDLKRVIYFSDGAASQYKNYKNFANLCHHYSDFKLEAEWNFFATSHGKSTCDGIGGTVKRLATRASLQRPLNGQILTPFQLFSWCSQNITGIQHFYTSTEEVRRHQPMLEKRFSSAMRVPGSRQNHSFVPLSTSELQVSRVSGEEVSLEVGQARC